MSVDDDKAIALILAQRLETKAQIGDIDAMLDKLFEIPPANIPDPATTKEELKVLLRDIKNDTATHEKIVRFIGFAKKLLGEK